jgi:hypothetical protein
MWNDFSFGSRNGKAGRTLGACLAAAVFAVFLGSAIFHNTTSHLERETEEQLGMISGSIAETVDGAISSESAAIAMLAASDSVIRAVKERNAGGGGTKAGLLRRELGGIQRLTEGRFDAIVVADRDGIVLADNIGGAARGSVIKAGEPFRSAMQGKASLDKTVMSDRTGTPVCILTHPVRDENGRVIGAVAGGMKVSFLAAAIDGMRLGKTGRAFVLDREGTAVVGPGSGQTPRLNPGYAPGMEAVMKRVLAGEKGVMTYTRRGVRMFAGFVPVKINGWSVLATVPADEMPYSFGAASDILGIAATILALFAAAAVYFSARPSTAPARVPETPDYAYGWILPVSGEQTLRINSTGREAIHAVPRQDAANAEESASAAQEMRTQAMHISGFVGDLVSLVAVGSGRGARAPLRAVGGKAGSERAARTAGKRKKRGLGKTGTETAKVVPLRDGLRNS